MIRVAAIGCGDIARRARLPELRSLAPRAELIAVAARDRGRLGACAGAFGVDRIYTDTDELLAQDDVDAVLVLTPPASHADLAVDAIAAGKHVLLEKPMTTTVAEAERIVAALERSPVVFQPLPDVDSAELATAAGLLQDGVVGTVTGVESYRGHRGPTHAGWFYRRNVAGGGVLLDLGIYALTEVARLFGPAERLTALCATRFPERRLDDGTPVAVDVEDIAMVDLWLEAGIAASVHASWNGSQSHHATRKRTLVHGREGLLAFGDGGVVVHRADGAYPEGGAPAELEGLAARRYAPPAAVEGGVVARFIDRIEQGDPDPAPVRRQVHVMEQALAAYAAAAGGGARLATRF
ncbi:MAG TPA: Gfo/Idh/MocA family oxidoreductase [Trueperaceae bacterium]|nr:Gfo/Idh/MocA family oxidoreductase [Trueperaceae bacterium]